MTQRAHAGRAEAIAHALHIDGVTARRLRHAADTVGRQASTLGKELQTRPDLAFLRRMKPWIYNFTGATNYRGSAYYVDIMGASHQRRVNEPSLEQILVSWLSRLQSSGVIPVFDVVLVPKDGSPLLAERVARSTDKPLIVCKGERDRSRVSRPDAEAPHETDFEGLRAFLDGQTPTIRNPTYHAVAIDDSCANGSQLASAGIRFNELITTDSQRYPFTPLEHAVVLFRVKRADGVDNSDFEHARLSLHALLAVGDDELSMIKNTGMDGLKKNINQLRADAFACEQSQRLLQSNG